MVDAGMNVLMLHGRAHAANPQESEQKIPRERLNSLTGWEFAENSTQENRFSGPCA
jgi:hypothetical protein